MSTGRFCTECGYQFAEDYGFCPRCGAEYRAGTQSTTGSANIRTEAKNTEASQDEFRRMQDAYRNYAQSIQQQILESARSMCIIMLAIWVVMSGVLSVVSLLLPEDIVQSVTGIAGLGKVFFYEGIILLVSCALALISLVSVVKRTKWAVAFYSCLGSTFSTLALLALGDTTAIYFLLCGLLASLIVRNIKPLFKE